MTYDIIIAHWGGTPDITEKACRCLETIRECSANYRVILVDNGTPEPEFGRMASVLNTLPHLLVRNRVNQGFIKATNQGICLSTAPYLVLMNNDTQAVPGWLEHLREPLDADPTVGLVGPRTTTLESWQGRTTPGPSWAMLQPGRMLAFFCTMFRREALDSVGLMCEDFSKFAGLGGDDHECWRFEKAGWRLALQRNLIIPHHHRTSVNAVYGAENVRNMQDAALSLFFDKRRETL